MVFWRTIITCALAATLLVVALVCTSSIQAATGASERRVALIIGNDTYTHLPALNNARKDAEDMAVKLRELGFETILKVNAGRREMHRALGQFEASLSDGATGLAFFAGHGIQSDGKNYLIPANANIEVEDDLRAEALTAQDVLAAMERAGNPLNIVILDACRDNPLPKRTRSARRGLTVVGIPAGAKGTAILYAAGEGQTAEDGPRGGNGVFTGELLRALDEPGLSLEQVFKRVNRRVQRRTNNRQRPWSLVSLQGDFVFRGGGSEANIASRPRAGNEGLFWQTIKDSRNKADFEAYLNAFPTGVFVPLAEMRLASLGEPGVPVIEIEELDATYVVLKTANLRAGPGTIHEKVGLTTKDNALAVTGRVKGAKWLRVAHAGGSAFVFAPLAKEIDPAELASWRELERAPGRAKLEAHLKSFGDGHFAGRAQAMLAALPPPKPKYEVLALSKIMQVDDGGVVIRTEPDGGASEVGRLAAGKSAEVTGKVVGRQWYRVAMAGGRSGFAFGAAVDKRPKKPTTPVTIVVPKTEPQKFVAKEPSLYERWRQSGDPGDLVLQPKLPSYIGAPPSNVTGPTVRWELQSAFGSLLTGLGEAGVSFTEKVRKYTNGSVTIKFFEPGALVPALQATNAVSRGSVDASFSSPGYDTGRYPELAVLSAVPFGLNADEALEWYLSGSYDRLLSDAYRGYDIVPMACFIMGAEGGGWFRKHIETVEDYRGLNIRFFGLGAKVVQRLGGSTRLLAGADIYPALERGAIDATEFSTPYIDKDLGFYQLRSNYHYPAWHQPSAFFHISINKNKWGALSEPQKRAVRFSCRENIIEWLRKDGQWSRREIRALKNKGVRVKPFNRDVVDGARRAWKTVLSAQSSRFRYFHSEMTRYKKSNYVFD
jgi:TRAP-type mannitol/chloroaromatic compound transport system substrate-binding protein/uncharacterized protein YraI